jgi:hypothetical protein
MNVIINRYISKNACAFMQIYLTVQMLSVEKIFTFTNISQDLIDQVGLLIGVKNNYILCS